MLIALLCAFYSTAFPSLSPSALFVITTIAGTGATSSLGDGGDATSAGLYKPYGVALDTAGRQIIAVILTFICLLFLHQTIHIGNVYVADQGNYRIRKVTVSTGIITTIAGTGYGYSGDNGPATSASLYDPSGVALDASGTNKMN